MEVNSVRKVFDLINNLNLDDYKLDYKIRKIDYCYELNIGDYTIYYEDIFYEKNKYLEICYKLNNPIIIKLNKRDNKYFRLIFRLLLNNYGRNIKLLDYLTE